MTGQGTSASRQAGVAPGQRKVLRRLFLTLFLRGRSARGLQKGTAPKSIGTKLLLTIAFYALFGVIAFSFIRQPVFTLSVYLHGMTFVFLGLFVAASSGEVLFNREEADILLHRPVPGQVLLWAKVRVLIEISLWLAGAFNLFGFVVGTLCRDGSLIYPVVHAGTTIVQALFCTGTVVLTYQVCLRWFGRERLDGMMTLAQVLVAIAAVSAGQILPRFIGRFGSIQFGAETWWIALLPPASFAGLDDAIAGSGAYGSWVLGGMGLLVTTVVLWFAFGRLANSYEIGLQNLGESRTKPRQKRPARRFMDVLVRIPPFRWWLTDPITRASFILTAAYLARDRDVKLRIYPGLAPMLVIPVMFLLQGRGGPGADFGVAFMGGYLGLIPMLGLNLLQYSQQWQASDLFRLAPVVGPARLCQGARWAVLVFLTLPLLLFFALVALWLRERVSHLALAIPGLLAIPVYALIPFLGGKGVPFSLPAEEAKSAGRGLTMIAVMIISSLLSAVAVAAWSTGWFHWLLVGEAGVVITLSCSIRSSLARAPWPGIE